MNNSAISTMAKYIGKFKHMIHHNKGKFLKIYENSIYYFYYYKLNKINEKII